MGNSLEHRISVLVAAVGIAIFCSGLLLFASSYLVEDILKDLKDFNDFGQNHCEYWAALPTMLTGIVLVASVFAKNYFKQQQDFLKYLSACCTVIIMVLVLGVVAEESGDNTFSHSMVDYCELEEVREDNEEVREDNEEVRQSEKVRERKKECEMLRKADKWFYVLLFSADITLVLSVIVLFALFADWILFTAMKSLKNGENSLEMGERYERFSTSESRSETQMWEGERGDKVPLTPPV